MIRLSPWGTSTYRIIQETVNIRQLFLHSERNALQLPELETRIQEGERKGLFSWKGEGRRSRA